MSFFLEKNKIFLLIGFLVLGFFIAQIVIAGVNDNVSGWAWSENIGWISFNCNNPELPEPRCSVDYGVHVSTSTEKFSGHAWSENIGWISFDRSDTGTPPDPPYNGSEDFIAKLDFSTNEVSGWAKALDIDVWIKLKGTDYGVWRDDLTLPNELWGWAWSDTVIGWISFNSTNCDSDGDGFSDGTPTGCPSAGTPIPDYKVVVDVDSVDPVVGIFNVNPSDPDWSSTSIDISWTVMDSGGSHLSHVEVWRANDVGGVPGTWSQVGADYNAPVNFDLWSSSASDSPSASKRYWYGLHVLDNLDNMGTESSSIKALFDKDQPSSQINSWDPPRIWQSGNFTINISDEDLHSGLDYCKYKTLAYDCYPPGPTCEYSTGGWETRASCSLDQNITVGSGSNRCPFQGRDACWVFVSSKDIAGNEHISNREQEIPSIRIYSIDWENPVVGEISPLTATQGVEQTFTASLYDLGSVSDCWLYKKNGVYQAQPNPVSIFPTSIEVNYTFATSGDYFMKFACMDAALNVGWGGPVTVSVAENESPDDPVITYGPIFTTAPNGGIAGIDYCATPTTQSGCNVYFEVDATDPNNDPLTYKWDFGDGNVLWQEDPSHHYDSPNTYTSTVYVFDGTVTTTESVIVVVTDPTLSVGLTADPAFGTGSLENVDLRAIVSGSMYGTINYKFDCTNDGDWELEASGQSIDDYTAIDLCNYGLPDDYTAKVFVERGGSAENTANINVVALECTFGQQVDCTSPQGCSHTITCQEDMTWPNCPTDECVKDNVRGCGDCGEQTCLSTCQWGTCSGEGECTPSPDCPDCLCLPDVCIGQDYYDYPDFGDCNTDCSCDTSTESGEPCEPTIITNDPQCNEAPICDSLDATPDSGVAPLSLYFTGSAHDNDGTITQYGFVFGDGGSSTTSESSINYIYNNPGTYCAKLRVQDNDGAWTSIPGDCPDVCTKQINISENNPPVADISCDGSGCGPGSTCNGSWIAYNRNCQYYFLNDSTDPDSTNPPDNNDIIKSIWSIFYDGGTPWQDPYVVCTDNPETPENEGICDLLLSALPASQNYYVTLTVEDTNGATDSFSKNFYVRREIAADFQCSLNPEEGWQSCNGFVVSEGEVVYFKDTSVISEGSTGISSWSWAFEDGDPATDNIQNPLATFVNLSASSGTITLDIIDNVGRTDSEQYQLQITIPLPEWEEVVPF